jgi:hypothetical protein
MLATYPSAIAEPDPICRHLDRVRARYGKGDLLPPAGNEADLIVVGCAKSKRATDDRVPAADLYTSGLFAKRRAYAEASGRPWRILSAKHGLVHPQQPIPPYDVELADLSREQRDGLAFAVARTLRGLGLPAGAVIELHAGARYARLLADNPYLPDGVAVRLPVRGLPIGEQLVAYKRVITDVVVGGGGVPCHPAATPFRKEHPMRAKRSVKRVKAAEPARPARAYAGPPIQATQLYRRDMPEFTNCRAACWMAVNEVAGTVTYANTYNDRLKASYDPAHYTFPAKPAVVARKAVAMEEVDVTDWPEFVVAAVRPAARGGGRGVRS